MPEYMTIQESNMVFGPFDTEYLFHIEKWDKYQKLAHRGVKMAEFLLLKSEPDKVDTIWIVEAKSSSPKSEEEDFIKSIREKFINAMIFGMAACIGRHGKDDINIPQSFKNLNFSDLDFKFILVVKGHKQDWLDPLTTKLRKELRLMTDIWPLNNLDIIVLNDVVAKKHGLIQQ